MLSQPRLRDAADYAGHDLLPASATLMRHPTTLVERYAERRPHASHAATPSPAMSHGAIQRGDAQMLPPLFAPPCYR